MDPFSLATAALGAFGGGGGAGGTGGQSTETTATANVGAKNRASVGKTSVVVKNAPAAADAGISGGSIAFFVLAVLAMVVLALVFATRS